MICNFTGFSAKYFISISELISSPTFQPVNFLVPRYGFFFTSGNTCAELPTASDSGQQHMTETCDYH